MSDGSSDNEEFSSYSESEEVSDYESSDASDNGSELSESEATESIKEPVVKPKKKVETKVINENEVKKTKNEKKKDIEENEIFKWGFTLSEVEYTTCLNIMIPKFSHFLSGPMLFVS